MAATQAIAGYQGKVYVGTVSSALNEVAEIGEWSGNISRDLIDIPKFDENKVRIYGKKDFSGSFNGSWYMGDTNGQAVLQDAITGGTTVYLKLEAKTGWSYSCWALISGEAISEGSDKEVTVSFDFSSSGKVAVAIATA